MVFQTGGCIVIDIGSLLRKNLSMMTGTLKISSPAKTYTSAFSGTRGFDPSRANTEYMILFLTVKAF